MVESIRIPINNPDTVLNQPEMLENSCNFKSPANNHVGDGCDFSIINNEKPNPTVTTTDSHTKSSQSGRITAGFYFRWTIIILNVGLELAQIILTLEASSRKIKGPTYRTLTATTSSICLILSAIEIAHASKLNEVVSTEKKRKTKRIGFPIWFGLVSSIVQFSVNVTALVVKRAIVNFEYMGFLFAGCYFFAAIGTDRSAGHVVVLKCVSHGSSEAQGKFVDGMLVFECEQCADDEDIKLA